MNHRHFFQFSGRTEDGDLLTFAVDVLARAPMNRRRTFDERFFNMTWWQFAVIFTLWLIVCTAGILTAFHFLSDWQYHR